MSALLLTLSMTGGFGAVGESRELLPDSLELLPCSLELRSRCLTKVSPVSSANSDTSRNRFEECLDDDDETELAAAVSDMAEVEN